MGSRHKASKKKQKKKKNLSSFSQSSQLPHATTEYSLLDPVETPTLTAPFDENLAAEINNPDESKKVVANEETLASLQEEPDHEMVDRDQEMLPSPPPGTTVEYHEEEEPGRRQTQEEQVLEQYPFQECFDLDAFGDDLFKIQGGAGASYSSCEDNIMEEEGCLIDNPFALTRLLDDHLLLPLDEYKTRTHPPYLHTPPPPPHQADADDADHDTQHHVEIEQQDSHHEPVEGPSLQNVEEEPQPTTTTAGNLEEPNRIMTHQRNMETTIPACRVKDHCQCRKGTCTTHRCSCYKENLRCTRRCKCTCCLNRLKPPPPEEEDDKDKMDPKNGPKEGNLLLHLRRFYMKQNP